MDYSDTVSVKGPSTSISDQQERAILVGVERPNTPWSIASSMSELARLADTAGAEVVATTTQRLTAPNPATFIGKGKAEEVAQLARTYDADVIIFDDELTPSQQSNLERMVDRNVKVIDRTALILDIFALHAKSREGRLQVRLAQNQYLYPRLRGMWAHLASNRMGGGVGSRFGEGESQLEVDRRMVRNRITSIKRELAKLSSVRKLQRENRNASAVFKVAIAGYTNAGKSSLLNRLCNADVLSYDKLFATLDSTTRKLVLPEGREVTLSDTVGFIQKLPTTLIEAFRSTLDEITGSDLILHVVDVSSEEFSEQMDSVYEVLDQIGASAIPSLIVFNKIDLLVPAEREALQRRFSNAIFVSAETGDGIDELIERIASAASSVDISMNVLIPFERGELVSKAHRKGRVISERYLEKGTLLHLRIPDASSGEFRPFTVDPKDV